MDKQALIDAITRSGSKQNALAEADDLWIKVDFLQQTGRFGLLLSQLTKANDKGNFLALVLEVNFAYQFESHGLQLAYEVKQDKQYKGSIDFLHMISTGEKVYFELRLLQQTQSIAAAIENQLKKSEVSQVLLDAHHEQDEVVRIQNTVLGKVQDKDGNPTKFFSTGSDTVNIVVVDASASLLGMVDVNDYLLATLGDPGVEEVLSKTGLRTVPG